MHTTEKIPVVANGDGLLSQVNETPGYDGKDNTFHAEMQVSEEIITSKYEHLRITDLTPIPEPEPFLTINGELIAVSDEFFTISGASKSGKSAFTGMLIAGSISHTGEISDGLEGVKVLPNVDNKAVIHFDTEQAEHKQKHNIIRMLKRADLKTCPPHFYSYNLRSLDVKEYQTVTTAIIEEAYQQCAGVHSIWIDGGADYITDVNDPAHSNEIIRYFGNLSKQYHTVVFIIVHTNPGSEKERGHFGSECQRRSGGIISIKTEGEISYIEGKQLRYAGKGDIPKLMFKYDKERGYHVGCGTINDVIDPETVEYNKRVKTFEICTKVFSGQRAYEYKDAIEQIMGVIAKSISPAKTHFTIMKVNGMIIQGTDKYWRLNNDYQLV